MSRSQSCDLLRLVADMGNCGTFCTRSDQVCLFDRHQHGALCDLEDECVGHSVWDAIGTDSLKAAS